MLKVRPERMMIPSVDKIGIGEQRTVLDSHTPSSSSDLIHPLNLLALGFLQTLHNPLTLPLAS